MEECARGAAPAAGGPASSDAVAAQARAASRLRCRRLSFGSPLVSRPSSVEPKLVAVVLGVLVTLVQDILHVLPRLGVTDVVKREIGSTPCIDVLRPRVVCGEGGDLV